MDVVRHDPGPAGLAEFTALARPLLDADPVRHTLALTVLHGMAVTGERAAALVTVHRRDAVVGAALRSEGWPILVSALPSSCAAAVEAVVGADCPGVVGPVAEAEAFAAAHTERTGRAAETELEMRLFVLERLQEPVVEGEPRPAVPADGALLAEWYAAFGAETGRGPRPSGADAAPASACEDGIGTASRADGWVPTAPGDGEQAVARAFALAQDQVLWTVDGVPVALAVASPAVAGVVRIAPVYTPPAHRGHGYASAATAAVVARARAAGARDVVLFTDLAEPVPNRIYPRLGFRPVGDARELRFR